VRAVVLALKEFLAGRAKDTSVHLYEGHESLVCGKGPGGVSDSSEFNDQDLKS
jgi:hypothetical protein